MNKKPPFRTESGKLGCPICETVLMKDKAPFSINEVHVGNFESWICPICNYYALTENGYEQAVIKAKQLATIIKDVTENKYIKYTVIKDDIGIKEPIQQNGEEIKSTEYQEWTEITPPKIIIPPYVRGKSQ